MATFGIFCVQKSTKRILYCDFSTFRYPILLECGRQEKTVPTLASKLLADALENFLRTCLEVTNYFATAASKTLFFSYRTGNTSERSILDDITPFSAHSYINPRVTVCFRELLKYAFGLKVLETLPGTSIPRRIHARKAE